MIQNHAAAKDTRPHAASTEPRPPRRPATWGARATPRSTRAQDAGGGGQDTGAGGRGRTQATGGRTRDSSSLSSHTHRGRQVDVRRVTRVVGKVSRDTHVAAWQDPGRTVPEGREPPGVCVGSQGRELPQDRPAESGAAGWPSPQPRRWPAARVASPRKAPSSRTRGVSLTPPWHPRPAWLRRPLLCVWCPASHFRSLSPRPTSVALWA